MEYFARVRRLVEVRDDLLEREPSNRAIGKQVKVTTTTVSSWFGGKSFPKTVDPVLVVVGLVRARAKARQKLDDDLADFLDEHAWREAYEAEARRRAQVVGAGVRGGQAARALAEDAAGRPLREFAADPLQLEVHRAIEVEASAGLGVLPRYVPRPHDERLAEVVGRAEDGTSGFAVLVGGSSTGKTRACWEAVRGLGEHWRLWQPISSGGPDGVLADLDRVVPHTVVWLNDLQHHLLHPSLGEQVAVRLRRLLHDAAVAPVLLLGTVWRRYWGTLTDPPDDGAPDPHPSARALLAGRSIEVPDAFEGLALLEARRAAAHDPRLAQAVRKASAGQITQYLAGVPALLERYRTAPAEAKAVLHAAMDARRFGLGPELPSDFLKSAAPGYLSDVQWSRVKGDWYTEVLRYTGTSAHGLPGPLTEVRPRGPRGPESGTRYELADYLEEIGPDERAAELPPDTFWYAAAGTAAPHAVKALILAARDRGLVQFATGLSKRAAAGGGLGGHWAITFARQWSPETAADALRWAVSRSDLSDATHAARLFQIIDGWDGPVEPSITRELARRTAAETGLTNPTPLRELLDGRLTGESAAALLARDPARNVAITDSTETARFLRALRNIDADEQADALAARVAASAGRDALGLQEALRALDGDAAAEPLAARFADAIETRDPHYLAIMIAYLSHVAPERVPAVLAKHSVQDLDLGNTMWSAGLVRTLVRVGADTQARALLDRMIGACTPRNAPDLVRGLVETSVRRLSVPGLLASPAVLATACSRLDVLSRLLRALDDDGGITLVDRVVASAQPFADLAEPLLGWALAAVPEPAAARLRSHLVATADLDDPAVLAVLLPRLDGDSLEAALDAIDDSTVRLTDPVGVVALLTALRGTARLAALLRRDLAGAITLDDAEAVITLLRHLQDLDATDHATAIVRRLEHAPRIRDDGPWLLLELKALGLPFTGLADALVRTADLSSAEPLWGLLPTLLALDADAQVTALLDRRPAASLRWSNTKMERRHLLPDILRLLVSAGAAGEATLLADRISQSVVIARRGTFQDLVDAFRELGFTEQIEALADLAANSGAFDAAQQISPRLARLYPHGREPDGTPSPPWGWHDLQP